jgi:hypothetical protein
LASSIVLISCKGKVLAVRKFEGLLHIMGEGLLKYLSFKMKVYPRNCLSYIISIFQYKNVYYGYYLPHPSEQT